MTIFYNDIPLEVPKEIITLAQLAAWKNIPDQGSAIALNDKLIKKELWSVTNFNNLDRITVITAAYGG